jgi:hypothetical protein
MTSAKPFRQFLIEALGQEEAERAVSGGIAVGEKLDQASLEGKNIMARTWNSLTSQQKRQDNRHSAVMEPQKRGSQGLL